MCGATIEAPCINNSTYLTCILDETIYIGLIHISELEKKVAIQIVNERTDNGDFHDLQDFVTRLPISREQLEMSPNQLRCFKQKRMISASLP